MIAAILMLLGSLLVLVAALISSPGLEQALVGEATGSLTWGPALFRALLALHGAVLMGVGVSFKRQAASFKLQAASGKGEAASRAAVDLRPWLVLAGLSVLALVLRLPGLDSCLWFDEVLTVVDFVRPPLAEVITRFPSQNQHMLFSVLAQTSVGIFGESAWSIRLPSVLFGVASVWAMFLLGRRLVGVREGLLAAALMTVSYHHVWFSQNARGYMGLLFFATLATWLWIETLSRRGWGWHLAYAVTLALGMWIHLTMVFVPLVHALLFVADTAVQAARADAAGRRELARDAVRPLASWLLGATLTLQLHALALPEFLREGLHEVSLESEWTNPLWVVTESLRSLRIGFGALAVVLCGALVAAAGWVDMARRDWRAATALALPPILGGLTMLVLGHNLWPRFFFFAMGFALLIAVHGAAIAPRLASVLLPQRLRRPQWADAAGIVLVGLMIAASAASLPRAWALPKQDFTGARAYVEAQRGPDDTVVAVGLARLAYQRYFAPDWLGAETAAELEALRRSDGTLWLVYTIPVELKAYWPELWNAVQNDFEVVKVFPGTLGGGEVFVCRERK
jgi:mannosyltransferase